MANAASLDETRHWGAPAPRGAHPADVAANAWERGRVFDLRRIGRPWRFIADVLGKPEITLRQTYEALTDPGAAPPWVRPATAGNAAPRREGLELLRAVHRAGAAGVAELAAKTGWGVGEVRAGLKALRAARQVNDLGGDVDGCWVTTPGGRAELARCAGYDG
jgi:hypothetical protein